MKSLPTPAAWFCAALFAASCGFVSTSQASLVGHWKFDEASGTTAADSSGVAPAPGTLITGASFQPAAGKFGGAVYLNGTSGYVDMGDVAKLEFSQTQSFALACWYKPDGDETTGEFQTNSGLMTKGYGLSLPGSVAYDTAGYYLMTVNWAGAGTTTSFFQFDSRQSSSATTAFRFVLAYQAPDAVVNGTWRHFVSVIDRTGNQARTYVDGVAYGTKAIAGGSGGGIWGMGVNTSSFMVGNHFARYTKGWFDDAGVWDHALTTTEITSIFNSGIAGLGDVDGDGLADAWETQYFGAGNLTQTGAGDPDSDGLTNLQEFTFGTNPTLADTDNDGLTDGAEKNTHLTNPLVADTDGDTLSDGAEVNTHLTNPLKRDSDGDNWYDNEELTAGTSPTDAALHPAGGAAGDLYINEILTEAVPKANGTFQPLDMDGDSEDWIELRNNGAAALDLIGWQLSDDVLLPAKWTFPHVNIPAGGYLLVYASGKNKSFNGVQPHTNFKLSTSGAVVLSRPDGAGGNTVVSQVGGAGVAQYPSQRKGFSYGKPDNTAAGALSFLKLPTPGAANAAANAVTGFVADTVFTGDRGLYSGPVQVTITSATPGATIAYTLNGSVPTETNGTQVPAVDGLTPPTATLTVSATTLLRARAWKADMGSSNVDTQSYIFPANVMTQNGPTPSMGVGSAADTVTTWGTTTTGVGSGATPMVLTAFSPLTQWGVNQAIATDPLPDNQFRQSDLLVLPTLSLVADWKDLFGPNAGEGIYPPASGVAQEGVDRAASLELLNPGTSQTLPVTNAAFQADGNIHVFGGTSQARWKSLKLSMRFQCVDTVNYKAYGDGAANQFDNFVLDSAMNNTWMHPTDANQRIRSAFSRDYVMADLQNKMSGAGGFHTRACHLYLNGMYWGIYWLHEKPDHHYAANYYGGSSSEYDGFKHSATAGVDGAASAYPQTVNTAPLDPALPLGSGTITALNAASQYYNCTVLKNYEDFLDLIGSGFSAPNPAPDLTQPANYAAVAAVLDIDHFIDYMLLNFVAGNQDWADKNLYCSKSRAPGGKWRFSSWDAEHTFRNGTENFIAGGGNEVPRAGQPKDIHNKLRVNAEYKLKWADHIRKHMFNGGALDVAATKSAFDFRHLEISDAIRGESARWGHTRASLRTAASDNFPNIPYKRSDWLTETLRITMNETAGGNSLIQNRWNLYMNTTNGVFRNATYNLYPTTEAPNFSQHGGAVAANYSLSIANPNAAGAGVIYYTLDGSDPRVALTGAVAPGAQTYAMPVTLASSVTVKSRILIGSVWSALNEAYFSVDTVPASPANLVISEFNYNPSNPTPAEVTAGFADANDFEYIELLNIGANRISLSGLAFASGVTFHFNGGSVLDLAPGARVCVVENLAAFRMRHGNAPVVAGVFELNSNLSNGGETITLMGVDGLTPVQSFAYNDKAPWPVQADGDGYSLVLIRPETNPDEKLPASWRLSELANDGAPGAADATRFGTWKTGYAVSMDTGDDDNDGVSNLLEYALRTNPTDGASAVLPVVGWAPYTVGGMPGSYLQIVFTRSVAADDITCHVEFATDLADWSDALVAAVMVGATLNGDGTVTETWRSATPLEGAVRGFGRMRVTWP